MRENENRQNMDTPSESQTNRSNNLRDMEKDKSRDPQKDDQMGVSKIDERDTKTDEYRNSKLSDTEIGGE